MGEVIDFKRAAIAVQQPRPITTPSQSPRTNFRPGAKPAMRAGGNLRPNVIA